MGQQTSIKKKGNCKIFEGKQLKINRFLHGSGDHVDPVDRLSSELIRRHIHKQTDRQRPADNLTSWPAMVRCICSWVDLEWSSRYFQQQKLQEQQQYLFFSLPQRPSVRRRCGYCIAARYCQYCRYCRYCRCC